MENSRVAYHWAALLARHWTSPGYIDTLASRRYGEGEDAEVCEGRSVRGPYEIVEVPTIEVFVHDGIGRLRKTLMHLPAS